MLSALLPLCRFHGRHLLSRQPIAIMATAIAVVCCCAAAASYFSQMRAVSEAHQLHGSLLSRLSAMRSAKPIEVAPHPRFQEFDSTQLVGMLSQEAAKAQLPLSEVVYTLDENGNLPYLRYRAMLTVSAAYPTIHAFFNQVLADLDDISLDNIACVRDDIKSNKLTCELAFSAFYRKPNG